MTSTNYTLYLQQGAGNDEDSEESDFSQESEVSSQGTESSQEEETENLEPWSRIFVASYADVLRGSSRVPAPRGAGTREPLRTSAWEASIFGEAEKRHKIQLDALINQYQENGDSENVARSKAVNALVPV